MLTPLECEQRLRKRLGRGNAIEGWVSRPDFRIQERINPRNRRNAPVVARGVFIAEQSGSRVTVRLSCAFMSFLALFPCVGLLPFLYTLWACVEGADSRLGYSQVLGTWYGFLLGYGIAVLFRLLVGVRFRSFLRYLKEALEAEKISG